MSLLSTITSAAGALPLTNFSPHGHRVAPQNLFGSLLQSLEQAVGLQTGIATGASTGTAARATPSHTANTSLQNYLNNTSRYLKNDVAPVDKFAAAIVDVKV